jgi:hypothetical protein
VLYVVPAAKNFLFPEKINRIEASIRDTIFTNCSVGVTWKSEASLIISIDRESKPKVQGQVSRFVLKEINHTDQERVFFAHAINQYPDGRWYLNQTEIWTDVDLKQVRRLEVKACDQLQGDGGVVIFEDHRPIFKCAVAVQEATCLAMPRPKD